MKADSILSALITQLKNNSNISYVSDGAILLGVRKGITVYPTIIIEPESISELSFAYPMQRLVMKVAIIGYIHVLNTEKQIVGDTTTKGILNFENDVKLALDADRTIAGNANHLDIVDTSYDFVDFPYRSFTMNVEILFEQVKNTR